MSDQTVNCQYYNAVSCNQEGYLLHLAFTRFCYNYSQIFLPDPVTLWNLQLLNKTESTSSSSIRLLSWLSFE